jgi:hypothetical protein
MQRILSLDQVMGFHDSLIYSLCSLSDMGSNVYFNYHHHRNMKWTNTCPTIITHENYLSRTNISPMAYRVVGRDIMINAWRKCWEFRVEAPLTDHLRYFAPDLEKYKVVQFYFSCRKIEIRGWEFFRHIYFLNWNYCEFLCQKLVQTYYQCLGFAITVRFNRSVFLT